jgi:hypothetical protein
MVNDAITNNRECLQRDSNGRKWHRLYYEASCQSVGLTTECTTGVRSPAGTKDFSSSLCVQPALRPTHSYPMGTGNPFPGGKSRPGCDADHSPHLIPRSTMSRSYISSPPCRLRGGSMTVFLLYIVIKTGPRERYTEGCTWTKTKLLKLEPMMMIMTDSEHACCKMFRIFGLLFFSKKLKIKKIKKKIKKN